MKVPLKLLTILFFVSVTLSSNSILAKRAAIIIDYDTQEVLFEVNADTLNYPASLAKIMTLYITFDYLEKNKLSWNDKMKVSETAASRSPSKLYLEKNSSISVKDAVMALIVKSANDVATVISEHIAGTERDFAKLMTKYAKQIGMNKTTFKNSSGLPNRAQLTTARDMATLSFSLIKKIKESSLFFRRIIRESSPLAIILSPLKIIFTLGKFSLINLVISYFFLSKKSIGCISLIKYSSFFTIG